MTISRLPVPDQPYPGEGKVLRVKEGFNPNSSSLGSVVFSMQAALIAAPVVLGAAAAWIGSRGVAANTVAAPAAEAPAEAAEAGASEKQDEEGKE